MINSGTKWNDDGNSITIETLSAEEKFDKDFAKIKMYWSKRIYFQKKADCEDAKKASGSERKSPLITPSEPQQEQQILETQLIESSNFGETASQASTTTVVPEFKNPETNDNLIPLPNNDFVKIYVDETFDEHHRLIKNIPNPIHTFSQDNVLAHSGVLNSSKYDAYINAADSDKPAEVAQLKHKRTILYNQLAQKGIVVCKPRTCMGFKMPIEVIKVLGMTFDFTQKEIITDPITLMALRQFEMKRHLLLRDPLLEQTKNLTMSSISSNLNGRTEFLTPIRGVLDSVRTSEKKVVFRIGGGIALMCLTLSFALCARKQLLNLSVSLALRFLPKKRVTLSLILAVVSMIRNKCFQTVFKTLPSAFATVFCYRLRNLTSNPLSF
jgi:hypothetical protein